MIENNLHFPKLKFIFNMIKYAYSKWTFIYNTYVYIFDLPAAPSSLLVANDTVDPISLEIGSFRLSGLENGFKLLLFHCTMFSSEVSVCITGNGESGVSEALDPVRSYSTKSCK